MRATKYFLSVAIATMLATMSSATEEHSSLAKCGHYEELAAAKRALEDGDKASALIHLRNADALLGRCQRDSERAADPADAQSADETVVGGAEAPPTPTA